MVYLPGLHKRQQRSGSEKRSMGLDNEQPARQGRGSRKKQRAEVAAMHGERFKGGKWSLKPKGGTRSTSDAVIAARLRTTRTDCFQSQECGLEVRRTCWGVNTRKRDRKPSRRAPWTRTARRLPINTPRQIVLCLAEIWADGNRRCSGIACSWVLLSPGQQRCTAA